MLPFNKSGGYGDHFFCSKLNNQPLQNAQRLTCVQVKMFTYTLSQAVQSSVHVSAELQVVQYLLILLHSYLEHVE